jgi:hypothetical protein
MATEFSFFLVEDMPFNMRLRMPLHLDGVSPHCSPDMRLWVSENRHGRWICRKREAPV